MFFHEVEAAMPCLRQSLETGTPASRACSFAMIGSLPNRRHFMSWPNKWPERSSRWFRAKREQTAFPFLVRDSLSAGYGHYPI